MPHDIDIPAELLSLIEKREEERRQEQRRDEPSFETDPERRATAERRTQDRRD